MATTKLKTDTVTTIGELPSVGKPAPDFVLTQADLSDIQLKEGKGKWIVLNIFPSIDTSVCAMSVRKFNEQVSAHPNTEVWCVSNDLPFAMSRFCGAEGIKNVKMLSDFRARGFGKNYGVLMLDSPLAGLLARAIVVVNPQGNVAHAELVPQIGQEPNYDAAWKALTA